MGPEVQGHSHDRVHLLKKLLKGQATVMGGIPQKCMALGLRSKYKSVSIDANLAPAFEAGSP